MPTNITLLAPGQGLRLLDQTRLPTETRFLDLHTLDSYYEAIYNFQVRGSPAFGIFAAFALVP